MFGSNWVPLWTNGEESQRYNYLKKSGFANTLEKTLNLIEYLIKNGSPRFVLDFRQEIYRIRLLMQFNHTENGDKSATSIMNKWSYSLSLKLLRLV